ncbi:unnamed protein product [Rotaria sp. Silwood2]|nr:unnamed protein product [Rotaria sp. Silwood2]
MSYATNLLTAYPPSYDRSTLVSDDLVQNSSFGTFYEPSIPYINGSRLHSDDLTFNQLDLGPTSYRSSIYSHFPATSYRTSSITDWRRDVQPQNTYNSLNNIREYSESLGTASNTTTASSVAHSINDNNLNGSMNIYPNYQQNYNRLYNDVDRNPHVTTMWNPVQPKIQTNDEKPTSTYRSLPNLSATILQKTSLTEISTKDKTPIPSPLSTLTKQENNIQTNSTSIENEKQQSSIDTQISSNEKKDETSMDEKLGQQDWTIKIDKLHTMKAQREKEKAKSSRALPSISKKIDNQPIINKSTTANDNKAREVSFQMRSDQPKTTIYPKHVPPRKASQYEPPNIANNSTKKQLPKQNQTDPVVQRENIHKDPGERFRNALTKFRSDRAEQQQRDLNESTAKRLNYGNYVRRSTKDDLLHNAIKPSPWSDFIDLKKGNLYSLTKEEKKELYNQSKSYGERVRYRNFALHYGPKANQIERRSRLWPTLNEESQSSDETTSHEEINDDDSKSSKRSNSSSTIKTTARTYTKVTNNDNMIDNKNNRTVMLTDQSSTIQASDEEDDDVSDFDYSRKQKQNKRFHKNNSSVRTTSETEETENDETSEQQSIRMKNRDTDDDLFTVREERTLESLEGARYKKR